MFIKVQITFISSYFKGFQISHIYIAIIKLTACSALNSFKQLTIWKKGSPVKCMMRL